MTKIFQDKHEPLFGRADAMLTPCATTALKEILYDYHPNHTNDELPALYTFTGGVPNYQDDERSILPVSESFDCLLNHILRAAAIVHVINYHPGIGYSFGKRRRSMFNAAGTLHQFR